MSFDQRTIDCGLLSDAASGLVGGVVASERPAWNPSCTWQHFALPPAFQEAQAGASDAASRWHRIDNAECWQGPKLFLHWSEEIGIHGIPGDRSEIAFALPTIPEQLAHPPAATTSPTNSPTLKLEQSPVNQPPLRISPSAPAGAGRWIAETAHDIRSPIATANQIVSMVSERLRRNEPVSPHDLGLLDVAKVQLTQADNWAESILLQRHLELGHLTTVRKRFYPSQLQNLVKPMLDSLADLRDIRLNWDGWDRSLPRLYTDASHLSRVIMNLGTNAIEASQPGQSVGIRVNGHGIASRRLVIDVHDHGPGLDPEKLRQFNQWNPKQEALFPSWGPESDPLVRAPGLGMTTAKSLMLGIGGSLMAASLTGGGTLMRASLPVDDPQCLISNWLLSVSAKRPQEKARNLQRVQIYAVRLRDIHLNYGNRLLQQAADAEDFVYRVAADRWLWLTLVDQGQEMSTKVQKCARRLNQLSVDERPVCLTEKVFQSRVFVLESLHGSNDDRQQLPFLLNSIASKISQLIGRHVPQVEDLHSMENGVVVAPVKRAARNLVRHDGAAKLEPHLAESQAVRNTASHGNQSRVPHANVDQVASDSQLSKALGEIARDWHQTQAKLRRSIRRVDIAAPKRPKVNYAKTVGLHR